MRKITSDAVAAFWSGTPFYRDNTEVKVGSAGKNLVTLYLFGNCIAYRCLITGTVEVSDGGRALTMTTKERINGLLSHPAKPSWLSGRVWTQRRTPFVSISNGRTRVECPWDGRWVGVSPPENV